MARTLVLEKQGAVFQTGFYRTETIDYPLGVCPECNHRLVKTKTRRVFPNNCQHGE